VLIRTRGVSPPTIVRHDHQKLGSSFYKTPDIFRKVKIPVLIVLAQKDEYRDRPINKIAAWFEKNSKSEKLSINVIPSAPHNFYKYGNQVLDLIKKFI